MAAQGVASGVASEEARAAEQEEASVPAMVEARALAVVQAPAVALGSAEAEAEAEAPVVASVTGNRGYGIIYIGCERSKFKSIVSVLLVSRPEAGKTQSWWPTSLN